MHHLYPTLKGDQLCPLGFHPQTRYPTRCKRCFRDYKEHGARRSVDDVVASSPNLSDAQSSRSSPRTWTSTQNLSTATTNGGDNSNDIAVHFNVALKRRPQSWASTPDIDEAGCGAQRSTSAAAIVAAAHVHEEPNVDVTVKLPMSSRRHTTDLDMPQVESTLTKINGSRASPSKTSNIPDELVILSSDNLAERVRKMNLLKKQRSLNARETTTKTKDTNDSVTTTDRLETLPPRKKTTANSKTSTATAITSTKAYKVVEKEQQKDSTLANDQELRNELKNLHTELEAMKARAERAEREKSDILLRRLAALDTASNRTAASEALMLQQKVNELKEQLDKMNDDKRKLNMRMKELENKGNEHDLKRKLQAAEQICEELMEENQQSKKEIMNLQAEMDELQDTFRDDEVKAKTNLQKDLEKATKNCRILSFKLKKSERRIEMLEQEKQNTYNAELLAKVKRLEEELRFSNELTRKLQAEADELRHPGKKRAPTLGVLGKSTSAESKFTRESLTRGGSQEEPQQLQRELQDSLERETDLKDQLKFAEEEAENLRKKVARFEDENDSLMMQLKKMATRSRTRRLSPTTQRLAAADTHVDRDEGISDEDDPAELRILLELNEQEAAILRQKVEELEKDNGDVKKQLRELQTKLRQDANGSGKTLFGKTDVKLDSSRQLNMLEQENEKLLKENKRLQQLQALRKTNATERSNGNGNGGNLELTKLKQALMAAEQQCEQLNAKIKRMQQDAADKLPARAAKIINDLTPKNQLKKWVEELEDEINEMRVLIANSSSVDKLKALQTENNALTEDLQKYKQKLTLAEGDVQRLKTLTTATPKLSELESKLKKSDEEAKKLHTKVKDLEMQIKKQDNQIKQNEATKNALELQTKKDKEKFNALEKDYEKQQKERDKLENKIMQLENELASAKKCAEKSKSNFEKEIKELKGKSSKTNTKQLQELKQQLEELQGTLHEEKTRYNELNTLWEKLSEETILMRAQLTTEKQNLQTELNGLRQQQSEMANITIERNELLKKCNEAQKKIVELEAKTLQTGNSSEYERTMLKNKLADKEHEYERLRRENEMNIDLVFQLRKDNDELNSKLSDYSRIEQAQTSLNGHSARMEYEIKELKIQLQNSELQMKSEVASTRLRYEQQLKNLSAELTAMQRQCERFKKDRDAFKQMLETAQKKIADLKANAGRQSRNSMHSSDDDDKSKIAHLEQQIGSLEDQLVEARLEVSKVKTELVSERSANEIKISEMQSKLNVFEEERVIGTGRTKIPGMKTKLELSWQKEREDQQRLLQETSTLARDLRQTLFEVERERDKERLESKRKLEQTKRATEEEMEEGRKKIAELQCDLLELRDVHAKLRTSNEKLRRERERYEKELIKRRMEQDGGERKIDALLQTVDELVKIAPNLNSKLHNETQINLRQRSPSPMRNNMQIANALARLAETSDELRKFQQRMHDDEHERNRIRRGTLRRAASQENDPHGSTNSVASGTTLQRNGSKLTRSGYNNSSLIRKSLSLDHSIQKEQNIWRQDDGSVSSIQSIDSELAVGGLSSFDSRLSGGSTQSDIPRGPRKKKKGFMGKLRSLAKSSRNSESEVSVQGSDSDISVASDMRASKKDLRGRLTDMFKRSGSTSRSNSTELLSSEHRPVAVTVVGVPDGPQPREPPPANALTPKPIRSISKSATAATPTTRRRLAK